MFQNRRRFFVPEVVQTSALDCGPASLQALLAGFHIRTSYGRLREACQTDVDGTSIDTIEVVAEQLGLNAQQILLPLDHVFINEAAVLPAIAVVRGANGTAHFVVVWRRHGPLVQVMDPARGRLWMTRRSFLENMVVHSMSVPALAWREWAGSDAFLEPMRRRLRNIGLSKRAADTQVTAALEDSSWRGLAAIDAGTRMVAALQSSGALSRRHGLRTLLALTCRIDGVSPALSIAEQYWSVRSPLADDETSETLQLRGAVLIAVSGRRAANVASSAERGTVAAVSPELSAALSEPSVHPLRALWQVLREDGLSGPAVAIAALSVAVVGMVLEAILLRSALDLSTLLHAPEQRVLASGAIVFFAAILLCVEFVLASSERRMGSHLEGRLRARFLEKIPRLADAYFHSRPMADMLERSHTLHVIRTLPRLAVRFLRIGFELFVTALALAWLNPGIAVLAMITATAAAIIPMLAQPTVDERDLRARTHTGALTRFHLDALLGRTALEAQGANRAIEREHEGLLAEWAGAVLALQRASVATEAFQMLVGFGLVAWILLGRSQISGSSTMLLQIYWLLNLPALGYELALVAREYPAYRSTILRALEPLGAPDFQPAETLSVSTSRPLSSANPGVRIQARRVSVRAAGHSILDEIDLDIAAGTHVAIVGASGAGKSTLLGLLLGWHRPVDGTLLVDDQPLTAERTEDLRRTIAWVDPTIQIWNRPLLDNLVYGSGNIEEVGPVLESCGLLPVVAKLPLGLGSPLGEGGALLSAGEAQRVRLARAMLRKNTRLVILDEPFLGLERDRRRTLLAYARQRWEASTLFYVTHDVTETRAFDRVLVIEHGRLIEDGEPLHLAQSLSSRYRRMLQAQESMLRRISGNDWKRVRLESGRLIGEYTRANEQTA